MYRNSKFHKKLINRVMASDTKESLTKILYIGSFIGIIYITIVSSIIIYLFCKMFRRNTVKDEENTRNPSLVFGVSDAEVQQKIKQMETGESDLSTETLAGSLDPIKDRIPPMKVQSPIKETENFNTTEEMSHGFSYLLATFSIAILGVSWFVMPQFKENPKTTVKYSKYKDEEKVLNRPKTKDEMIMEVLKNAAESKDPIWRK